MRDIALFVEDFAHQKFLGALFQRMEAEHGLSVKLDWRNVRRGHGAVIRELKQYLRDLQLDRDGLPDLVVVATDANCKGLAERSREIGEVTQKIAAKSICAVPDPHIERWMLLDSFAFKKVFGRGCAAPDQKCERARYKRMLIDAIRKARGITPSFGGFEFAEDIVQAMDLDRSAGNDASFGRLLAELRSMFKGWQASI